MTMLPKDLLHLVFSFVEGMGINEAINACFVHYIGLKNHTQGEHPDVEYKIKLTGPLGEKGCCHATPGYVLVARRGGSAHVPQHCRVFCSG